MCSIGCRVGGSGRWGISYDNCVSNFSVNQIFVDSFVFGFFMDIGPILKRSVLRRFG